MLTVTAQHLISEDHAAEQISLFHPNRSRRREKLEHLERTVDSIRNRYGTSAIVLGSVAAADTDLYGKSIPNKSK